MHARRQAAFSRLLVAFESPAYRRLWISTLFNSSGGWMIRVAVGWLVLDLTDSPFWVGLIAGLEGVGLLAAGLFAGVLLDRLDRRQVLLGVYVAGGLLTLAVGLMILAGRIAPWHLLGVALLQGALFSIQSTANNTVTYQIAGPERLMNATAAKMLCFNLARIGGSALGGAVIAAAGVGPCYLIAGGLAWCATIPLLSVQGSFRPAAPTGAFWRAAARGIGYVWETAQVRTLWFLSAAVETFAFSHLTMIPVMARDVLHVGAAGLGWLSAAGGLGASAGTLVALSLGNIRRKADTLLLAASGAGLALVLFALSRSYVLSLFLVAAVSLSLVLYDVLMNTLMQLLAADEVRGRVLSLYTLTFGLNSLGGMLAGAVASALGAPLAVGAGGGLILAYLLQAFKSIRQVRPAEGAAAPA